MQRRLHSLSDLSSLFGPDAKAPVTKNGGSAEAGRREVQAMENIQLMTRTDKVERLNSSAVTDPVLLIQDGLVRLGARDAGAILRRCRYEKQNRDLKPHGKAHIEVLADIMRRGQWRGRDQLTFALVNGCFVLLNGHHRLAAQERSGEDIDWVIAVHSCKDELDLSRLYYTFDTNVRGRSNETILSAMDAAEQFDLTKTVVEALFRSAPLLSVNFDFSRTALDPVMTRVIDRRMELMRQYANEARAWKVATKRAPTQVRRKLMNQGAFAVALTAFRHRPYEAEDFYRGLSENDGLNKGDPRKTYLMSLLTAVGTSAGTSSYTARQAATAWNAWFRQKPLSIIKIVESHNFVIAGTPVGR